MPMWYDDALALARRTSLRGIGESLRADYDAAVAEPLPERFTKLIAELEADRPRSDATGPWRAVVA
jgi:Anti-sigma factor NepR